MPPGIEVRHQRSCERNTGVRCRCSPQYRAQVYLGISDEGRQVVERKTFPTMAAARSWKVSREHAKLTQPTPARPHARTSKVTVREAAADLISGMQSGRIRNRSGDKYKLNVTQQYRDLLANHLLPRVGPRTLASVTRRDVQRVVDELCAEGHAPSTVRNAIKPLGVIFRRAMRGEIVVANPMLDLDLPRGPRARRRIASPSEVRSLLLALRRDDQALWGTAFYAGLRLGEIAALRWSDVDLAALSISVERGYDFRNQQIIETKNRDARRVPIADHLHGLFTAHLEAGGRDHGLIFGVTPEGPFRDTAVRRRAVAAWQRAGLDPIMLHEARHTFASTMIAAGIDAKSISVFMGHADIQTTFDIYGHLMPRGEEEAVKRLNAYLAR